MDAEAEEITQNIELRSSQIDADTGSEFGDPEDITPEFEAQCSR